MIRVIFMAMAIALAWLALAGPARAHDIYKDVRVNGLPCCGGDPVTGDCEALSSAQISLGRDIRVFSKRWGVWVVIPEHRVQWMPLPGEPEPPAPGHWCGKPREKMASGYGSVAPADADQPDPAIWTYCIFLGPPGT